MMVGEVGLLAMYYIVLTTCTHTLKTRIILEDHLEMLATQLAWCVPQRSYTTPIQSPSPSPSHQHWARFLA